MSRLTCDEFLERIEEADAWSVECDKDQNFELILVEGAVPKQEQGPDFREMADSDVVSFLARLSVLTNLRCIKTKMIKG